MFNKAMLGIVLLIGGAQTRNGDGSGNLTVTALVTSSVCISFDVDGKPVVVLANAPADEDTLRAATELRPKHVAEKPRAPSRQTPDRSTSPGTSGRPSR